MTLPKLIFEATRIHLCTYTPDTDLNEETQAEQKCLSDLQKENGWCSHLIERLYHTANYSVLHWLWASNFNALDKGDNGDCSRSKCHALHIASEAEYPEAHAKGCDRNCARFYLQTDQVLQALSPNRIPIVSAKPYSNEVSSYSLSVTSFDPKAKESEPEYVAFSHVWSDGLGSTTEQGIPSCQAQFLARVSFGEIVQADGSASFSIDSLCIPRDKEARRKGVELMSSTYQLARTVLVLDDTIRTVSLEDKDGRLNSPELFLFRIYTSPWSHIVWTYQEAGLAQKLVFLLAEEKKITLDFSVDSGSTERRPLALTSVQAITRQVYRKLLAEVQALNGLERAINLGTVALQLRWRDTLHRNLQGRNDEILAVGTLLGLNMETLLNGPEGIQRIVLFYKLVRRLYRNIVFADVPRLQSDGFRWAPATFLVMDERRPHTDLVNQGVDCTEHGLLGAYVTFSVEDGRAIRHDGTQRITLVVNDDQRSKIWWHFPRLIRYHLTSFTLPTSSYILLRYLDPARSPFFWPPPYLEPMTSRIAYSSSNNKTIHHPLSPTLLGSFKQWFTFVGFVIGILRSSCPAFQMASLSCPVVPRNRHCC